MMIAGTEHRRQGCSLQDGKQWGYYVESQNPTDYRYWSIPFTSHYITMATKTYYEPKEEAVPWLVGIDMQKFICGYGANFIGSSYVSCVGIGCQPQWGENVGGGGQTVSLPISFEVAFTAVVSADSSWCNASCHITTTTITTMNYQSNKPDIAQLGPVQWLAIGIQPQWGYQKQLTVEPVVYPLPVNTVCCVWAHSIHDRQDPGTYHSILSKITPVGVQILAGQYNAPATAYSGISAYWGMIGW